MLALLGHASLDDLARAAVPASILLGSDLDLPEALPEIDVLAELRELGHRNRVMTTMIGLGYYGTHTPQVVLRKVLENPAWYTAYTPYQPEISQGRLEALLNYQTMVCDLTALPVANASLLDEATAAAEAMTVARRTSKAAVEPLRGRRGRLPADARDAADARRAARHRGRRRRSRRRPAGRRLLRRAGAVPGRGRAACATSRRWSRPRTRRVRWPAWPPTCWRSCCSSRRARWAPTSSSAPRSASASRSASAVPHAAYMSVRAGLERALPGRLVGLSIDADGNPALRLALQTREQHIRREKATSQHLHRAGAARRDGVDVRRLPRPRGPRADRAPRPPADRDPRRGPARRRPRARARGVLRHHPRARPVPRRRGHRGRPPARHQPAARRRGHRRHLVRRGHRAARRSRRVWSAFRVQADIDELDAETPDAIPAALARSSDFLTHPVFSAHRSETQMLRYLRTLSGRDVALDRSMIPLGSCTMKLNATTEMQAVSWPEFSTIHPFAPLDQADGYVTLIDDLERWLCAITGYDAVSLQPNAGSQGEFAGLLAIRDYHRDRGDEQRDVCLIPSSAHGTNAASAVMAGMRVVVVACDELGNVDLDDLRVKLAEHGEQRRGADDHLPLDARRLRAGRGRDLRARARRRRPGLRRRRQPQRARRARAARAVRRRRLAPEPAQDVLHPARRRRARHRPGRGARPPAAASCPTIRCSRQPGPRAARARSRRRPGARPASCRSRGPTSG